MGFSLNRLLTLSRTAVLLGLIMPLLAGAAAYRVDTLPDPRAFGDGHVANPDQILSDETQRMLDEMLITLQRDTGAEVAVVAVQAIEPANVFEFAQGVFNRWGIGHLARDDGLLILLVVGQRQVRLHTGYGLEGTLPDLLCRQIEDEDMLPHFRNGDFDAGVLAGTQHVAKLLRDPEYAAQYVQALRPDAGLRRLVRNLGASGVALASLSAFVLTSLGGYFRGRRSFNAMPPAFRWGRVGWLVVYLVAPIALVILGSEWRTNRPVLLVLGLLYAWGLLLVSLYGWRQQRHISAMSVRGAYPDCVRFLMAQQVRWTWLALLFPVPALLFLWHGRLSVAEFRARPRPCPNCGSLSRRLSEEDEDAHLAAGQQTEETIQSREHDVWWCDTCRTASIFSFAGSASRYSRCPDCHFLTRFEAATRVVVAATTVAEGQGERDWACAHCQHTALERYAIPRLNDQSNGPALDSGSSGSHWGGGSSGGGGASRSW